MDDLNQCLSTYLPEVDLTACICDAQDVTAITADLGREGNAFSEEKKGCRHNPPTQIPGNNNGNWADSDGQHQSEYPGNFI